MELANRPSIYKRGEPLVSHCISSNAARGIASRPKNRAQKSPRTPHIRCARTTSLPLPHLHFWVLHPFSKKFLKIFSPRAPATVRRALNSRAAPSRHPKTAEFRGKTAHTRLATVPKPCAKHRLRAPKNPPLTPLHIKKLSKVRSTLLTAPPRECILEYMRLKAAAQTTPHGAARAAPTASKTFKLTRLALEEAGH